MITQLNKPFFITILLTALLLLAYGHTFNFPFQFDDYKVIVDEPKVHSVSAWWQSMPGMRPLLKLSYALNWQFDQSATYFRLINWLVHGLNSGLVGLLSLKLLAKFSPQTLQPQAIALLAALLFALHPAHSEVVVYISSRSTALMGLFSLAAIICALHAFAAKSRAKYYLSLAFILFLVALSIKESALILLFILLIIKLFYIKNTAKISAQYAFKIGLIFIAALAFAGILLVQIPRYAELLAKMFSAPDIHTILLNQGVAHAHYLSRTLLGLDLNVDYQLAVPALLNVQMLIIWAALIALLVLAWLLRNAKPLISLCIVWWFVWLLPTNSILQRVDLISDRQIYMASIGPIILLSVWLVGFTNKLPQLKLALATILFAYCFGATWLRASDYASEISLWQASVEQEASNPRAWNNLGYALMLDKKYVQAQIAFENALQLDENHYRAFYNLQDVKSRMLDSKILK